MKVNRIISTRICPPCIMLTINHITFHMHDILSLRSVISYECRKWILTKKHYSQLILAVSQDMDYYNFTTEAINGPILAAVFAVEMTLALIANGIILLITITQRKSWKQSSTIFFTSLILAHLVMNILYLPLTIIAVGTEEWVFGATYEEKKISCSFAAFTIWYMVLVISMTLAAISFDRFLFIVKPHLHKRFMRPWVALTLTIAIWLLAALLNSTPFFGIGEFGYATLYGTCVPYWEGYAVYVFYMLAVFALITGIIILTSVWTFCFTRNFLHNQSLIAGNESIYTSRRKKLFGIFGTMLIVYTLCISPGFIVGLLSQFLALPGAAYVLVIVFFDALTIINPLVQSYFRLDVKACLSCMRQKIEEHKSSRIVDSDSTRI